MLPQSREQTIELARKFAPTIGFDRGEPFLPTAVGATVLTKSGPSPSSDHFVRLREHAEFVIEYAIWWDWDIQHLYELEHIWLFVSHAGSIERVEASAHGQFGEMRMDDGSLPLANGRPHLLSEPGKHAFFARSCHADIHSAALTASCGPLSGAMDILVQPDFADQLAGLRPYDRWLARRFMRSKAFAPDFIFDKVFDLADADYMIWPELKQSIPGRVLGVLEELRNNCRGPKAVFLDSGDTLIDEGTEVRCGDLVLSAKTIPGALEMLAGLRKRDILTALVADGLIQNFNRVHGDLGITRFFATRSVSSAVGATKPERLMFDTAAEALGLRVQDYSDVLMVGNNLRRDIAGANAAGLVSVHIAWSPRRRKEPCNGLERPDHVIRCPLELLDIVDAMAGKPCSGAP